MYKRQDQHLIPGPQATITGVAIPGTTIAAIPGAAIVDGIRSHHVPRSTCAVRYQGVSEPTDRDGLDEIEGLPVPRGLGRADRPSFPHWSAVLTTRQMRFPRAGPGGVSSGACRTFPGQGLSCELSALATWPTRGPHPARHQLRRIRVAPQIVRCRQVGEPGIPSGDVPAMPAR